MLTLRPYQASAVEAIEAHPRGMPGALFIGGVGSGKTEIGLTAAARELDAGGRVVWVAHRETLLDQPYQRMMSYWPKHAFRAGFVQGARDAVDVACIFASIHTITRPKRLAALLRHGRPTLVVIDEGHHVASASYQPVIEAFAGPDTRIVMLTATPDRADGASLGQWVVVGSYDMMRGVREGWNAEPFVHRYPMPAEVERSVNLGRLDLEDPDQAGRDLLAHVVGHTVRAMGATYLQGARLPWRDERRSFAPRERSWMVFCASRLQARETAKALIAAGWSAASISSDPKHTDRDTRALLLRRFRAGDLQVLCNADLLTEGVDAAITGGVVIARRCASRPLYVQILGRAARLWDPAWTGPKHLTNRHHPDYRGRQDFVAIDLVGCSDEHSIIAAPVLVGDECAHAWEPARNGPGAACDACGATRPCWDSLERGRDGQHAFRPADDGKPTCRWCSRVQCADSKTGRHVWRAAEDHKHKCRFCPAEYTDPLAGLIRDRAPAEQDERFVRGEDLPAGDVALVQAAVAPDEVWAVDLDAHGLLLLRGSRAGAGCWSLRWNDLDVGPGGYDTRHAWAVAADVIRQTTRRKHDMAKGREVWGGLDERGREALRARARAAVAA